MVSTGYTPLSIGTETDGSLVVPASRAALYAIKPTVGLVSQHGIIPVSHNMDAAGPVAKTPYDIALLLDIMREDGKPGCPEGGYATALTNSWHEISVAAVNYETWFYHEDFMKPVENATIQMVTGSCTLQHETLCSLVTSTGNSVPSMIR